MYRWIRYDFNSQSSFADDNELDRTHPETDDEGIEKDSGECDDDRRPNDQQKPLDKVLKVSTL